MKRLITGERRIHPFTETRPVSKIKEGFNEVHTTRMMRRAVLTPNFSKTTMKMDNSTIEKFS